MQIKLENSSYYNRTILQRELMEYDGNALKVLIGCEFSDAVASAFRAKGDFAVSCDLRPSESADGIHLLGDVTMAIRSLDWDIIIIHPPCTALACSGNRWYGVGQPKHAERLEAIDWTMALWEQAIATAPCVALENPVGVLPMKATQYIQPYEFGHPEQKRTGLWLHNLPPLRPTNNVKKQMESLPLSERQRVWYLPPSADREKERSRTYAGIAAAMASQWRGQ